jgi:hypothetical protein
VSRSETAAVLVKSLKKSLFMTASTASVAVLVGSSRACV